MRRRPTARRLFDAGTLWQLHRQGAATSFRFTSPSLRPRAVQDSPFNAEFTVRRGHAFAADCFRAASRVYPLEYPLDELLMVNLLALGRGVEVHGCGVADSDGRGYLFLGQSGAGKSTMARLWTRPGVPASSATTGSSCGCSTAGCGCTGRPGTARRELASARRTPVDRIFFLARGERNESVPLAEAETVARLMTCSFVPFHSRSGLDFTLAFLQQVTRSVACAELRFVPDERAVDFVREHAA